ncbi:unnamed protein product [Caenorhabditis nigoni]
MERGTMKREQQASGSDKKGDKKLSGDNERSQHDAQQPKSYFYPTDNRDEFNSPIRTIKLLRRTRMFSLVLPVIVRILFR